MKFIKRLTARFRRTALDVWIDDFARVYAENRGPKPFDYPRREGESIGSYRARFEAWLTQPSSGTIAAKKWALTNQKSASAA